MPSKRIQSIISRIPSRCWRVVPYLIAAYFSLALAGYGLAWSKFQSTNLDVLRNGGRRIGGQIASLRLFGIGPFGDYFLRMTGSNEEFMIPSVVIHSPWIAGADIDLSAVSTGKTVLMGSSGGAKPVVLELILKEPGAPDRTIMEYNDSAVRYAAAVEHASELSTRYLLMAIGPFVLALLLDLLVLRRRFSRATAIAS